MCSSLTGLSKELSGKHFTVRPLAGHRRYAHKRVGWVHLSGKVLSDARALDTLRTDKVRCVNNSQAIGLALRSTC